MAGYSKLVVVVLAAMLVLPLAALPPCRQAMATPGTPRPCSSLMLMVSTEASLADLTVATNNGCCSAWQAPPVTSATFQAPIANAVNMRPAFASVPLNTRQPEEPTTQTEQGFARTSPIQPLLCIFLI